MLEIFSVRHLANAFYMPEMKEKEWERSQDIRWSSCLKQCKKDLDDTDNGRFILLLIEDMGQKLLYRGLPEDRQKDPLHVFTTSLRQHSSEILGRG